MKNRWKILKTCAYLLLVMVLGITSVLAACSSTATQTSAPTTTAATKPAATTSKVPNATADKVTICLSQSPDVMDPLSSQSVAASQLIMRNVFDSLVFCDLKGKPAATVASWEILDGGKCYEFKVRQGIKFTNGDPLTARDVEFSWNRLLEKCIQFKGDLRFFDHLEVVDDYTIRIYLTQPSIQFLLQNVPGFVVIGSKSYFEKAGEAEFVNNPVGSGPYKFVEYKSGQYVDLERNEDYWGEKPQVKQVRFVWSTEAATSIAMLKAGEIDILPNVSWEGVPDLVEKGFKAVKAPSRTIAVQFGMANPNVPWANLKVRQAIDYAIDKEAIINKLFYGIPSKIEWLPPDALGYDPTLKPAYPYDLAKAKALLAEAGYPNGFEMPLYKGGLFGASVGDTVDYLTLALREVGIKCNVIFVEGPKILEIFRAAHSDPTTEVVSVTGMPLPDNVDPVVGLAEMFYSPNPKGNWYTPELDALIDEGLATMDDAQRGEIIKQGYKIVDANLPVIPIMQATTVYAMKPNIDWQQRSKVAGYFTISDIKIK